MSDPISDPPMSRRLWNPDDLDRMRMVSDPLGDAVVAEFGDDTKLAATLLDSLVRTGDGKEDTSGLLRRYRQKTRPLPPWVDRTKIDRAQKLLASTLVPGTILLAACSLPQCYLDKYGAPVLTATQQLTEHIFRRLIQTSHMIFTVYEPGSLYDDESDPEKIPAGIDKAQTVRLMHALMRNLLMAPVPADLGIPKSMAEVLWAQTWDTERLGKPINQEDEAFVLLTFSYIVIEGFAHLAIILGEDDKDAILHLWNVIGYIMGVNEGLMAHTYEDATVLYALFRARLCGASEQGQMLTKALVDWINGLLPPFLRWFDAGGELIDLFNGSEDAKLLGVGPSGTDKIVHAVIASLLPSYEKVAHMVDQPPPFGRLIDYLAKKMIKKVWEATENDARQINWPDHVRVVAEG